MRGWLSKVVSSGTNPNRRGQDGGLGGGTYGRAGSGGYGHGQRMGTSPGEELIKAQLITRICEQLKQEIQRILKSAKDAQNIYGGTRWPGTNELLALLGGPPVAQAAGTEDGATGVDESMPDHDGSEDGNQNLLGSLEELIDHSQFTSRCLETALAPNLGHCLRLMRVIELEAAAPPPSIAPPPMPPQPPPVSTRGGRGGEGGMSRSGGGPNNHSSAGAPVPTFVACYYPVSEPGKPITVHATARIAKILVKLCQESAVVEQLRHHMEGLFKLTTASYPPTGVHIQAAAFEVVDAISINSLSSSLVWFIHDRQIVMQMADDMADLCRVGGSSAQDDDGDGGGGGGGPSHSGQQAVLSKANSISDYLLSGQAAEEAGMWLTAVKAVITLVWHSCRYSAALLSDLEEARGYVILKLMVLESAPSRRPEMLARLVQLVGAGAETVAERHGGGGDADLWAVGQQARNAKAFDVIRDVLIEATPFLAKALGTDGEGDAAMGSTMSSTTMMSRPMESSWVPKNLANVSREAVLFLRRKTSTTYTAEDATREQLQLQLLSTVLQIYSNHPRNYSILEPKFLVLSLYLSSLSSFILDELKVMVIKTLEYVCSGVANCAPTLALYAASYTLTTGCECFLTNPPLGNEMDAFVNNEIKENLEMVCATFEKLMQFDHQFVDTLCTSGVVSEVCLPFLVKAVQLKDRKPRQRSDATLPLLGADDAICYVCRILTTMLHPDEHEKLNQDASKCFRTVRLYSVLHTVVGELGPPSTQAALRVLELGALADKAPDKETPSAALVENLTFLVELLQSCRHERWRQLVVLKVIKNLLTLNANANDLWRALCGFEAAIAALSSLDGAFTQPEDGPLSPPPEERLFSPTSALSETSSIGIMTAITPQRLRESEEGRLLQQLLGSGNDQEICLELIKQILRTITIAVSGKVLGNLRARVENRQYLKNEIGYLTLKQCLLNAKVLTRERYSREIVDCVFAMVTEDPATLGQSASSASLASAATVRALDRGGTIKNADAVLLLLSLLTELPRRVATYILKKLLQLIANSTYVATEQLCTAGALRQVVVQFRDILHDPDDPLYPLLLRLLSLSGRHRINVPDAISILRCLAKPLLPSGPDGRIVLCMSSRRQKLLHPDMEGAAAAGAAAAPNDEEEDQDEEEGGIRKPATEEQWKSLLILAELAETSDSVPFLRLGGGRSDLLSLARRWALQEPKEIAIMDFDAVYAATAYSEGMRFLMVPTVGGAQSSASSSGFSFSCWFRFGVEDADYFTVSSLTDEERMGDDQGEGGLDGGGPGGIDEVQQRILWLLTVCSVTAKSSLQVYYDLTHKQICVESFVVKQNGAGLDTKVCPVDLEAGMWHNLVLIYNRTRSGFLSNRSMFSIFIDGVEVVEPFRTDHNSFLESHNNRCFIGVPLPDTLKVKPSVLQGLVSPIWHLGPHLLVSEAMPGQLAATAIFAGGPSYVGTFQGERPVHSALNAVITSLLHRIHRMSKDTLAALVARGLQDVLRVDVKREDDSLLNMLMLRIPHEQIIFSFHAGHASPCQIEPPRRDDNNNNNSNNSKKAGRGAQNLDIYHEPCYRLVNTLAHLSEEARSQWGVVFGDGVLMNPLCISDSVFGLSGPQIFFPLMEVVDSPVALCIVLELVRVFCKGHTANLEYMQQTGYRIMVFLLGRKKELFTPDVLRACVALAIDAKEKNAYHGKFSPDHTKATLEVPQESVSKVLVDSAALRHLALNWELWGAGQSRDMFIMLLTQMCQLLSDKNPNAAFNAHRLHNLGMVRWTLSVMMQAAKLSSAQQQGWVFPRVSLEDAHWGRSGSGAATDPFLGLCSELLQQLLATRMTETDMQDIASVLLSTVSHVRHHTASARSRLFTYESPHRRMAAGNVSAVNGSREWLSAQATVRACLLEVLLKLLTPKTDSGKKASMGGAQGVVKKVMDFFTMDAVERLGGVAKPAGTQSSLIQDDRQEVLKALGKCMSPEWFLHILQGSRDSLSISLMLRTLFVLLQEREDYVQGFSEVEGGFSALTSIIPQHSAAPIVLLPIFALVLGLQLSQVSLSLDLRSTRLYDVLEPMVGGDASSSSSSPSSSLRVSKQLFGALMGALMECFSKNIGIVKAGDDEEVGSRSKYCIDEAITCLSSALEDMASFREACRSKEFIAPLVTALFACADTVNDEQTRRLRNSVTGLQVPLSSYVTEDYLNTITSMDGEEEEEDEVGGGGKHDDDQQQKTRHAGEFTMLAPPAGAATTTVDDLGAVAGGPEGGSPPHVYFNSAEASKLLQVATMVLRDSILGTGAPGQASAPAMVKEMLVAFPSTSDNAHVYGFQEAFLSLLSDLTREALGTCETLPVSNTVAISGVLFDDALSGLFSPTSLLTALDLSLRVVREISGTRMSKSLPPELQQLLQADAVSIAQAFVVVALRRASTCNEQETSSMMSTISSTLNLLLLHTKRPVITSAAGTGTQRPGQNTGWRKALAQTLSAGSLDDSQDLLIMSPALELSRSMNTILRSEAPARVDVFQVFAPDKEEAFVTCLLAEMFPLLMENHKFDPETRRTALRICDVLLQQRMGIMKDLLSPEVKDIRTKDKRIVDIYKPGFAMLVEAHVGPLADDEDPLMKQKFRRFEFWLQGAEVQDDIMQVYRSVKSRATSLLTDDYTYINTSDVLDRLRAGKVTSFLPSVLGLTARPGRADPVSKAYDTFLGFHQQVIRSGQADMANGSVHWKRVMRSLRGVGSVWEGADMFVESKDEKWPITPVDAKTAAREAHQTLRWKLDMTEGPERLRRRLCRNYEFDDIYRILDRSEQQQRAAAAAAAAKAASGNNSSGSSSGTIMTEAAGGGGDLAATTATTALQQPQPVEQAEGGSDEAAAAGDAVDTPLLGLTTAPGPMHNMMGVTAAGPVEDSLLMTSAFNNTSRVVGSNTMMMMGTTGVADLPQDLRATAKLIKQVALVRKNSGARGQGRENEEDEFTFDDEEEDEEEEDEGGREGGEATAGVTAIEEEDENDLTIDMTGDGSMADDSVTASVSTSGAPVERKGTASPRMGLDDRHSSSALGATRAGGALLSPTAAKARALSQRLAPFSIEGAAATQQQHDALSSQSSSMDDEAVVEVVGSVDEDPLLLRQRSSQEGDGPMQDEPIVTSDEGRGGGRAVQEEGGGGGDAGGGLEASTMPALMALGMPDASDDFGDTATAALLQDLVCNELIAGFVDESDGPLSRVYNVHRCIGLETRQGILLVCRHAMVVIDGFVKVQGDATGGWSIKRLPPNNGGVAMRFSVFLRDKEEEGSEPPPFTLEQYSDAVRINREEQQEEGGKLGEGSSNGPQTPRDLDPASSIGFDLDDPPNVERVRFDRLKIMYKRRYQFRHVGIEFFDVDGRSLLVAFETVEDQLKVVELVLDSNIINSVFVAESSKLGGGKINYKRFMQHWKSTLTTRWQGGRLSNFEYLMHLNALAGRSFHDLTQYPVFPWVLADYTSTELDLNDPATFRDLRKPMGALGEARARQFRERYEQLASLTEDMSPAEAENEPPPFHYGTHYSCAGYVLYYLLRLEPYTRLHLSLQGGKFDKSDRLFRDIRSSWESASRDNLQDVRELIPEFYYMPDFLVNSNHFDFGWLQKGIPVNHVMLPPWAHSDAREFIRLQRMALESKYVSENLCYWVDLIFGYKQQGQEAIDAQNLFVHLTYENSAVDIDAIADPVIREATLAQINNFGQTPSRLFKRPHPARKVPPAIVGSAADGVRHVDQTALAWHQSSTPSLCMVGAPHKIAVRHASDTQIGPPLGGALPTPFQPVGDVWIMRDRAIGVGIDCTLVPPNLVKYARFGSPDNGVTFRVAAPTARHREIDRVVSVHEQLHLGWVSCMAIEDSGELAVTGSKDSTVRVWSLIKQSSQKSMTLQATLCGHSSEVLCVDLAPQIGNLLSGGADRVAIVWDLRDLTAVRLLLGHTSPVTSVSINKRTGDMVTLAGVDMRIWSISGELLAQVSANVAVKEVPTCVVATSCPDWQDGVVSITGHDNGKVCLWGLQNLSGDDSTSTSISGAQFSSSSGSSSSTYNSNNNATTSPASEEGEGDAPAAREGSNSGTIQGRQIKLMQILAGGHHTSTITSIRVGRDQRDLAIGDATGKVSRWVSLRLEEVSKEELAVLHV